VRARPAPSSVAGQLFSSCGARMLRVRAAHQFGLR
jgi:hypothetical protein